MARTGTQLIQGVGRRLSARSRYVASAGTGGSGTWTDATNLADTPVDWHNGMWLYHLDDNKEWRVTDDDGAGVLTLDPTTTPSSTSAVELHAVRPSLILTALNDAAQRLSSRIGRTRHDFSYVTDSPLFNAGFEDTTGATAIDGWAATTVTMTRDTTADKKLGGQYSVALTAANGYITPTAEHLDTLLELRGYAPTLYVPCKTATASAGRVAWTIDGTTTYSSYHTGASAWETLSVAAPAIASGADAIAVRLYRDGGTVYYDNAWIEGGPRLYTYRMPGPLISGPSVIHILDIDDRARTYNFRMKRPWAGWHFSREEDIASATTRNYLHTSRPPSQGRWHIYGWEPLTAISARADNIEVDEDRAELLEVKAAIIILEEWGLVQNRMRLADLKRVETELMARVTEVLGVAQLSY